MVFSFTLLHLLTCLTSSTFFLELSTKFKLSILASKLSSLASVLEETYIWLLLLLFAELSLSKLQTLMVLEGFGGGMASTTLCSLGLLISEFFLSVIGVFSLDKELNFRNAALKGDSSSGKSTNRLLESTHI